jgi:YgiT-type zinc finger domain-containing protein
MCKGRLNEGNVNHIVDTGKHIVIIKNVPANVCQQCGEYYIEHEIALKLEEIIEESKNSGAEVIIINYPDKAVSMTIL